MRTGDMDRRVTLQRFTTTQDEYGEEIQTWTDLATVFAEVRQQGGKEYLAAATTLAERRVVFFLRWFPGLRSEEHTSELQSLMRISYAVFCLQKKTELTIEAHTYN